MKILRWIAVLPAAFIGSAIVTFFVRLLVQFGGDHSLIALMAPFVNAAFCTVAFFVAGIYVAPARRDETATVLAVVFVLNVIATMIFMPSVMDISVAVMMIIFCFLVWKGYRSMHGNQQQRAS